MTDKKLFKKDLNNLSIKDLVRKRTELNKQTFSLKMQHQAGSLKQTHLLKVARRNKARVNTALSIKIKEQKGQ